MLKKRVLAVLGILVIFGLLAYLDTRVFAYSNTDSITAPAASGYAITPNDSTDLSVACRAIWVGGAGNIYINFVNSGTNVGLIGINAGVMVSVRAKRVYSTNTTATNLVCLY